VVPEAVGKNDIVLPPGAECDSCNAYLGQLDNVLAKHPLVALGAQLLRVPGKKGRVRRVIGTVRQAEKERAIAIPVHAEECATRDGSTWRVTPLVDSQFDDFKFRRSLHHVGLNVIAYQRGIEVALESRFDPVRSYVREPKPSEKWGFGQLPLFNGISSEIRLLLVPDQGMVAIGMRLFAAAFYVDLLNSGALPAWIDGEKANSPDLRYWGPADGVPVSQVWDGKPRFEVLIDLELPNPSSAK
jgi:hypothetical protein